MGTGCIRCKLPYRLNIEEKRRYITCTDEYGRHFLKQPRLSMYTVAPCFSRGSMKEKNVVSDMTDSLRNLMQRAAKISGVVCNTRAITSQSM